MNISFLAAPTPEAKDLCRSLEKRYGACAPSEADVVVSLGGDGLVLQTLYSLMGSHKPVFALRCTNSVGFMCNDIHTLDQLPERLANAQKVTLHPLRVEATTVEGKTFAALAINEVSVLRDSPQAARLRVLIDGVERLAAYSGDGLLVATPAGSTAYNHSAGGPIMPLDSNTLVMTAICGHRPRRWSYAVLPQNVVVEIEALETDKRPVRIEAGQKEAHRVRAAKIFMDSTTTFTLLFDPDAHLGERIVREQFMG